MASTVSRECGFAAKSVVAHTEVHIGYAAATKNAELPIYAHDLL